MVLVFFNALYVLCVRELKHKIAVCNIHKAKHQQALSMGL